MLKDWFDPKSQGDTAKRDVLEEQQRQGNESDAMLFVYPTVQGCGRRLFPDGYEVSRLRLLDTKTFRSGIILQRYAPA